MLSEIELSQVSGGGSIFSAIGNFIGSGLVYIARGLSATTTATQTRWARENS